jgi:hypothetical protein
VVCAGLDPERPALPKLHIHDVQEFLSQHLQAWPGSELSEVRQDERCFIPCILWFFIPAAVQGVSNSMGRRASQPPTVTIIADANA